MVSIGTDNKKKLYMLAGLAGVLGILVAVVILPKGGSGDPPAPAGNTAGNAAGGPAAGAPPASPAAGPAAGAPAAAAPAAGAAPPAAAPAAGPVISPVGLLVVPRPRADPFLPYYTPTLPPPPPTPPPLPPPPPLVLPGLDAGMSDAGVGLSGSSGSGGTPPAVLVGLPGIKFPQASSPDTPDDVNVPGASSEGPGGVAAAVQSTDKRLSGIVIGDSIHALLEISTGTETITRVVRPGDEIEGIKILRIGRIEENGIQVTRMYVLENGEERYFDLRGGRTIPPPPAPRRGGNMLPQP